MTRGTDAALYGTTGIYGPGEGTVYRLDASAATTVSLDLGKFCFQNGAAAACAAPYDVPVGGQYKIAWSAVNATSCRASGSWSGSKPVGGSLYVASATAGTYTYTLTCGTTSDKIIKTATVNVGP